MKDTIDMSSIVSANAISPQAERFDMLIDFAQALAPDDYNWSVSYNDGISIWPSNKIAADSDLDEANAAIDHLVAEVLRLHGVVATLRGDA